MISVYALSICVHLWLFPPSLEWRGDFAWMVECPQPNLNEIE
jgi:hypothetical protein